MSRQEVLVCYKWYHNSWHNVFRHKKVYRLLQCIPILKINHELKSTIQCILIRRGKINDFSFWADHNKLIQKVQVFCHLMGLINFGIQKAQSNWEGGNLVHISICFCFYWNMHKTTIESIWIRSRISKFSYQSDRY